MMRNEIGVAASIFAPCGWVQAPRSPRGVMSGRLPLKSVLMWICDDHHFVPPVEIMARAAGKQMVEDMLAMLDPEDQIEILKAAEENLRKM